MSDRLTTSVLVLNRLWQPVHICSARRAISLLFLGHAQVVHTDKESNFLTFDIETWVSETRDSAEMTLVRTISSSFGVPEIIVLQGYDRIPKKEVKFTRVNIFERDDYTCQYCGKEFEPRELNLDHVIPRDKNGRNSWENLVTSCIKCNTRKANRLPHEINMHPLRKPKAPTWRPFVCLARRAARHQPRSSWRHFLDLEAAPTNLTEPAAA